jgi:multicomponent Na+:H+ antiporter subunit C
VSYLPYIVAAWLFMVGLYGIVTSRNLIHLAVCLTVTQSSTYVLLLAIGYKHRSTAPVFYGVPVGSRTVVALILALTVDIHRDANTVDPDEIEAFRG